MWTPCWLIACFILSTGCAQVQKDDATDSNVHHGENRGGRDNTVIENMSEHFFNTSRGSFHQVTAPELQTSFVTTTGCQIQIPSGEIYTMETFDMDGAALFSTDRVACGINITVVGEEMVGRWILMHNFIRFSNDYIQRRYPITVHVEEVVHTLLDESHVQMNANLHMRLNKSVDAYDTCQILPPNGLSNDSYEADPRYPEYCGFIVRNVDVNDEGSWEIRYGKGILYRAFFNLIVTTGTPEDEYITNIELTLGRAVDMHIGSQNVVYCRLKDPQGFTVFDGHGKCNLKLERVTIEHQGDWKMTLGHKGRVVTDDIHFHVDVIEAVPKIANTSVTLAEPTVTLSCSVSSSKPIRSCEFREPSGRVLIAAVGVGESRYVFHGTGVSYESGVYTHECGIRINDVVPSDLGLWRCTVETDGDNYYGFLRVLSPWVIRDPEVAAEIITEPSVTAERRSVVAVAGDVLRLACSVQSPLTYCYFRSRNGTVYNVSPGHSHGLATYVGAGLNAGECGVRLPSAGVNDTGEWSCNVGLHGGDQREQRAAINVTVHDSMVVEQRMAGGQLHLSGQVYGERPLEYCRFVRIDGLAFRGEELNIPNGFLSVENLAMGKCGLVVDNPTMLDRHPWTVVARIQGQDGELSKVTTHTIDRENDEDDNPIIEAIHFRTSYSWIVVMSIGLALILVAMLIGPKNNRQWIDAKAGAIRQSFRSSFRRKFPAADVDKSTAVAA